MKDTILQHLFIYLYLLVIYHLNLFYEISLPIKLIKLAHNFTAFVITVGQLREHRSCNVRDI